MSDRILSKYAARSSEAAMEPPPSAADPDGTEDLGSFGWLRGQRERAVMLELRKKTGEIRAIGYAWMEKIDFDPSDGITLHAAGEKVRITGRNLNAEARPNGRLFQGLARQRVPWIAEAEHGVIVAADRQATVVESIEW